MQWLPNLVEAKVLQKQPGHVGSTFRQVYVENGRRMEMTGIVTTYEQDRRLACSITGKTFDLRVDYLLDDLGGRTRLTQYSEILFKGVVMTAGGSDETADAEDVGQAERNCFRRTEGMHRGRITVRAKSHRLKRFRLKLCFLGAHLLTGSVARQLLSSSATPAPCRRP